MDIALIFMQIALGWAVADLLSGIYHLLTDRGWNLPWFVREFQRHHDYPNEIYFNWRWLFVGLPFIIFGTSFFWWSFGIGVSITQLSHQLAHTTKSGFVKTLQNMKLLLPQIHHEQHHRGKFDISFCVLCGWNNFWFDYVSILIPLRKI